ncbi:hypothetical protein GGU45_001574 [Niabella hirudinis]
MLLRLDKPAGDGNFIPEKNKSIMSPKHQFSLKHKKNGYLQFLGGFFICGTVATVVLFIYVLLDLLR